MTVSLSPPSAEQQPTLILSIASLSLAPPSGSEAPRCSSILALVARPRFFADSRASRSATSDRLYDLLAFAPPASSSFFCSFFGYGYQYAVGWALVFTWKRFVLCNGENISNLTCGSGSRFSLSASDTGEGSPLVAIPESVA